MDNNEFSFEINDINGNVVKCDTLAVFTPEETGSSDETYVIYTDYTMDDKNNLSVFISRLVSDGDAFKLENIEDYDKYPILFEKMHEEYNKLNAIIKE